MAGQHAGDTHGRDSGSTFASAGCMGRPYPGELPYTGRSMDSGPSWEHPSRFGGYQIAVLQDNVFHGSVVDHPAPHKTVEVVRKLAERGEPLARDSRQRDFVEDAEKGRLGTMMQTSAYDGGVRRNEGQIRDVVAAVAAGDDEARGVGQTFAEDSGSPAGGGTEVGAGVAWEDLMRNGFVARWMAQQLGS